MLTTPVPYQVIKNGLTASKVRDLSLSVERSFFVLAFRFACGFVAIVLNRKVVVDAQYCLKSVQVV